MQLDYELIFGMDKQMHLLGYTAISVIIGLALVLFSDPYTVKRRISNVWLALVMIGILEEYRQYVVPNRSAEFLDAVANGLGVTIGLATPMLIVSIWRNRQVFLSKRFALCSVIPMSMFGGLLFLNERPFVTLEGPIQERFRSLVALIGL